jgi:hypothetical protein
MTEVNEPGAMRVSDAEREAAVETLKAASVDGRLSFGELTARTEAAYTAVTQAQLAAVTADLPAANALVEPAPPRSARRWFVAVLGETKRRGKWRVDQSVGAVSVLGDVLIDLREAEVRDDVVDLMAVSVMGDVKIIVPDGVVIDLGGMSILGSKRVQVEEPPSGTRAPVVRIQAYAVLGEIKIIGDSRAEPVKRAWEAWRNHWRSLH